MGRGRVLQEAGQPGPSTGLAGAESLGESSERGMNKYRRQRQRSDHHGLGPPGECEFYQKCNGKPWKNLKAKCVY